MLLKFAYLLTCRVLGVAVLVFRADRAKDAEMLVLRHENAVCAATSAECDSSRPTGCGSPRWQGSYPARAGLASFP
jgi:hypothetical protein